MEALAEVAGLPADNKLVIKTQPFPWTAPPMRTASAKAATSTENSSCSPTGQPRRSLREPHRTPERIGRPPCRVTRG
jgi:hypothetical protein